ncbi:sugar ABC transporter ATP-binding protein [Butyricicoccus faecihominis]|uniref:sugar ABC transporter ATP-binding protein n=1 Tax=Butyricicoccaceae TaxID=3085642 RepID=UPI0024786580|nr:sugar ABC transporter ATP-binding protein [Agathobaculum sp. NTUH-O15-33]MCQ5128501.1 sugar ABC transporter ATP-binding protein [Butyricicoccus faecihominis]WNX83328.1 sugar ABC transporter ATP-binding protein [Agathobaculum sp. NTUH-O15-33]
MHEDYMVEMRGIKKQFPGVLALDQVDLFVKRKQIHAIVGENGAGKSTLMKVLSGIYPKDEGEVLYDGRKVEFRNAMDARNAGIGLVHQEPQIIPTISIAENICLGELPKKGFFVDQKGLLAESKKVCEHLGIQKPVTIPAGRLSMGEQQLLQFARALYYRSRLIIMDEPTSSLTEHEKEHIFGIVRKLRAEGVTFVYITHRMEELFELCDEATILKDGKLVDTVKISEVDKKSLVNLMVGREVGLNFPKKADTVGDEILRVENLGVKDVFRNISFSAYAGEVLGFGGLIGAGRTEIMDAIFGMRPADAGTVVVKGRTVKINSPNDAIAAKIAYVTEDRHSGMVMHASIRENMTLASLKMFVKHLFINETKRGEAAKKYKARLSIRAPDLMTPVDSLSGGNQQKVVFAKWLMRDADLYIFDEPTRGVDVGAKEEIYKLIRELTNAGKAAIVISSELPELIGMSDRILVIHNGEIAGELAGQDATESLIIQYATGVVKNG